MQSSVLGMRDAEYSLVTANCDTSTLARMATWRIQALSSSGTRLSYRTGKLEEYPALAILALPPP